jgi:hypothetical protein
MGWGGPTLYYCIYSDLDSFPLCNYWQCISYYNLLPLALDAHSVTGASFSECRDPLIFFQVELRTFAGPSKTEVLLITIAMPNTMHLR